MPQDFTGLALHSILGFLLEFVIWFLIWMPGVALLEYIAHRWIMHRANFWLDPQLIQLRAHGKHHQGVNDDEVVELPLINALRLTAPFFLCLLVWGYVVGSAAVVVAPALALLTWCIVYPFLWNRMHRAIHDMERSWFRRRGPIFQFFMQHHLQHHQDARVNFGTVFPWTDYVFRTHAPRSAGRKPTAASSVSAVQKPPADVDQIQSDSRDPGLLIRLAMKLCEVSPFLKTFLWRRWYQYLAGYQIADWQFMNYGFSDQASAQAPLELQPSDEANRFAIQLYHRTVGDVDLKGLEVLEVGSGRGGGASFLKRYHGPKRMTGIDFSRKAVRFCRDQYQVEGLSFVAGDATAMSFADESFDAVINVESSHCYKSMPAFLAEVYRVLRPGGYFLFADLRTAEDSKRLHDEFLNSGLTVQEREEITPRVVEALERDSDRKLEIIQRTVSPPLVHTFREFAAIEGSEIYRSFCDGGTVYQRYRLQKPLSESSESQGGSSLN